MCLLSLAAFETFISFWFLAVWVYTWIYVFHWIWKVRFFCFVFYFGIILAIISSNIYLEQKIFFPLYSSVPFFLGLQLWLYYMFDIIPQIPDTSFFSGQKTVFSIGLLGVLYYTTAAVCPLEKAINVGNLPHVGHFFKILTLFQSLPVLENFPELSSGCFGIISRVYRCYRGRWVC